MAIERFAIGLSGRWTFRFDSSGYAALVLLVSLLLQCQLTRPALGGSPSDMFADDEDANHGNELRLRRDLGLPLTSDGRGELLHNYSHLLPPHNKTNPVRVEIDMIPILVRQLDTLRQTLILEGWFKMAWKDTRFRWKPRDYGNISVLRVPDHQIWQPDIKVYNTAKMTEIDLSSDVYCLLYSDGGVMWIPPITTHTICEVDLKRYPYDSHWCSIKMGSWTHGTHSIDLNLFGTNKDTNKMSLNDMYKVAGEWEVVDTEAKRSVQKYECCEETYGDVTFKLKLRRRSPFYSVTILCPLVAAVILALVAFLLPPYANERITVNAISFVTLLLILKHLADVIPPIGSRSPIVVVFCGDFALLVAISTAYAIYVLSFLRSHRHRPTPRWIRVTLNSAVARVCCIGETSPIIFAMVGTSSSSVDGDKLEVLHDAEDPHGGDEHRRPSAETPIDNNQWTRFFKFVDRIAFIFFALLALVLFVLS